MRALANVGSLRDFERFLRACALRSANLLNKADFSRDVGIAPSTASQWLSILEASGQIVLLEPWLSNRTKSIVKSPKLYLADTGVPECAMQVDRAAPHVEDIAHGTTTAAGGNGRDPRRHDDVDKLSSRGTGKSSGRPIAREAHPTSESCIFLCGRTGTRRRQLAAGRRFALPVP